MVVPLHDDLKRVVFSYGDWSELRTLSLVCKAFRKLVQPMLNERKEVLNQARNDIRRHIQTIYQRIVMDKMEAGMPELDAEAYASDMIHEVFDSVEADLEFLIQNDPHGRFRPHLTFDEHIEEARRNLQNTS